MTSEERKNTVACIRCHHYQVTWEAQRPYGCRGHNFKSRKNPAAVVFESSGMECQLFKEKKYPKD